MKINVADDITYITRALTTGLFPCFTSAYMITLSVVALTSCAPLLICQKSEYYAYNPLKEQYFNGTTMTIGNPYGYVHLEAKHRHIYHCFRKFEPTFIKTNPGFSGDGVNIGVPSLCRDFYSHELFGIAWHSDLPFPFSLLENKHTLVALVL